MVVTMRVLHEKVLELIQHGKTRLLIYAPTGYGKTVLGPALYKVFSETGLATTLIHVLPLRAIIRQFTVCTLAQSLLDDQNQLTELRKKYSCKEVPEHLRNSVRSSLGSIDVVAYQMGEDIEPRSILRKEPLFDARYVVTTFDSLVYNLFRVPVSEIFRERKHYAIPRLRIFIGATYFDEAHAVFEEESEESTIYTSFKVALRALNTTDTPIVLASASLSENIINDIHNILKDLVVVRLGAKNKEGDHVVEVFDREFLDLVSKLRWKTEVINRNEVVQKALMLVKSEVRVFIACDSIKSAIGYFKEIKKILGDQVILVHSMMTKHDKEEALNRVASDSVKVLVATSVVEAGVNLDFDALITDGLRPTSIIQRTGRICRNIERCADRLNPTVYLIREHTQKTVLDFSNKVNGAVNWRLPFDYNGLKGYQPLLEASSLPSEDPKLASSLEVLLSPLFVSSDTIEEILKRANYALARAPLVGGVVAEIEEVETLKPDEADERSITLSADRVTKLVKRGCVTSLAVADEDSLILTSNDVCTVDKMVVESGDNALLNYRRYLACVRKVKKEVVFIIDPKCYEEGVGLVV